MKLVILTLAVVAPLLVSCAPQAPVVHRYYHYREQVITDSSNSDDGPSRPARRRTTTSAPAPTYTLPGTPTRLEESSR